MKTIKERLEKKFGQVSPDEWELTKKLVSEDLNGNNFRFGTPITSGEIIQTFEIVLGIIRREKIKADA